MRTIQLYGVRDALEQDVHNALMKVGEIGYRQVEFAGFYDTSATQLREWLDEAGLSVYGSHMTCDTIESDFDDVVAYHRAIGCDRITINRNELFSKDAIADFVRRVNRLQPLLYKHGIQLGFHNHRQEFEANSDDSVAYPHIVDETMLNLQLDVLWIRVVGLDPVALMEQYGERVQSIHLKDGLQSGVELPLGQGEIDLPRIYREAKRRKLTVIAESETLNPSGLAEAEICFEYLKRLEKED
jgi:sugar phosphate isomerase/epimerase